MIKSTHDAVAQPGFMVAMALLAVVCGLLATEMALVATTVSYSVMAVLIVAALVLLFYVGTLFRSRGSSIR
jgi:membrane protein YdbS with pleckstrin-like domain